MNDILIKAEGVSKKFCKSIKHVMLYGAKDIAKNAVGLSSNPERLRDGEFWAVDDASFELKRGETLGIIGPNGSGKSTILKMLNGIFMPDRGRIEIKGRVGALIEVGAGFHPMLTGRENIYVNGSILGMSKKAIDRKFDEIVDFAEIEEFIDSPVKHYSSGMRVRLGFAIAAHMEPDVMIIDEVLAVGDVGFRAKCFNKIAEISKSAAILLVSHAMPQVARICSDVLVLNNGKTTYSGMDVPHGIDHYYSHFDSQKGIVIGSGRATIHKIEFESDNKRDIEQIRYLDDLIIHMDITVSPEIENPTVGIGLTSQELQLIAECTSLRNGLKIKNTGKPLHVTVRLDKVNLNPGIYYLVVGITAGAGKEILIRHTAAKKLKVTGDFVGFAPAQLVGEWNWE